MYLTKAVIIAMITFITLPVFAYTHHTYHTQLPQPDTTVVKNIKRKHLPSRWRPIAQFTFYPGSLQKNIERIAKQFGWTDIIWQSDNDYAWAGKAKFVNNTLPDILGKVLRSYPLQAVFYQGNHVLVISPRNI